MVCLLLFLKISKQGTAEHATHICAFIFQEAFGAVDEGLERRGKSVILTHAQQCTAFDQTSRGKARAMS